MVKWLQFFAGLTLLLVGFHIMSSGFRLVPTSKIKFYLTKLTGNRILGLLTGTIATMVLQSSSVTTVMVVGLVNSGLLNLTRAIPVIIGANIGTTITAQILAFNLMDWAFPLLCAGFVVLLLTRARIKYLFGLGKAIFGIGLLYLGLNMMSGALKPLRESPLILNLLLEAGEVPLRGILMGALVTFLFQSSSAVIGVVMAMAMQGIVSLPASTAIILGADMGTCITSMIASIGTDINAKRTALAHLIFNIIGAVCLLPLFYLFVNLIRETSPSLIRQIANAHTFYNIFNAVIILPFVNMFAGLIVYITPEGKK